MKNIIVPTDFSENAKNAFEYAINIANHFGATLHLIHVYEVRSSTGMMMSIRDFLREEVEANLSELVKSYKHHLLHHTNLEAKAIEGYSMDTVARYARSRKADLIVMGTQGASGLKEVFFGSNTVSLLKKSARPILAIPAGCAYQAFKSITFALDEEIIPRSEIVEPLVALAKAYNAKINVLHVEKTEEYALVDPGVEIYLADVDNAFHLVQNPNIPQAINDFVANSDTQLLCMLRRERSFLENLFHTSITKKEAFHSSVPLLVLNDQQR